MRREQRHKGRRKWPRLERSGRFGVRCAALCAASAALRGVPGTVRKYVLRECEWKLLAESVGPRASASMGWMPTNVGPSRSEAWPVRALA